MRNVFGGRSLRGLALSLFATLVLALGLFPAIALAEEVEAVSEGTEQPVVVTQDEGAGSREPTLSVQDVQYYDLTVGTTRVSSENLSGNNWIYNPNSETLTLNNYYGMVEDFYGISNEGIEGLTINLVGDNYITARNGAIYSGKDIVISGSGTLTTAIAVDPETAPVAGDYGIHISGGDVTINGGTVTATGNDCGIYAENGGVKISGGTVTANGSICGIFASGGDVTISRGAVNANGLNGNGIRVQIDQNSAGPRPTVAISGGEVEATGASNGIYAQGGDVTISGGTVVATGEQACGINTSEVQETSGDVTISGKVTGTSVTATGGDCGIYSYHDVMVSGGMVVAKATHEDKSAGIYAGRSVAINGGDVTAKGKSCIDTTPEKGLTLGEGVSVWAGDAAPGDDCTNEKFEKDYSMYAWARTVKAETYTVTVDKGIRNGAVSVDKTEAAAGESVKVTAKAAEGYELDTVTVRDADGMQIPTKNGSFTMPANDVTVSATFTKKAEIATITFDLAGGTLDGKTGTYAMTAEVGAIIKLPAAPTRDGYTFMCWKGSEYAAGAKYKVTGDHKFTAAWIKNAAPAKAAKPSTTASVAKGTIVAKWKAVSNAKSYEISWRVAGGKWKTKTVKVTSYTITGLKAGKLYDVRVRGVDGSAKGAWSTPARSWMKSASKVKAATGKSKGSVKVTWNKDKSATGGYKVFVYAKKGGKAVKTKTVSKAKVSATIKGLKSGKRYYVRVCPLRAKSGATYAGALSGYRTVKAK